MRVAFVIFDGMTALDFVGVYDPVTRLKSMGILPDFSGSIRAWTETVTDDRGLQFASSWREVSSGLHRSHRASAKNSLIPCKAAGFRACNMLGNDHDAHPDNPCELAAAAA